MRYIEPLNKAHAETDRVRFLPVREQIVVTGVREVRLAGGERLFIIKGHVEGDILSGRSLRTPDQWKSALCQQSIGGNAVDVVWQRNPFDRTAYDECDLISVQHS